MRAKRRETDRRGRAFVGFGVDARVQRQQRFELPGFGRAQAVDGTRQQQIVDAAWEEALTSAFLPIRIAAEQRTNLDEAAAYLCLDGAEQLAGRHRDFGVSQPLDDAEQQNLALAFAELLERASGDPHLDRLRACIRRVEHGLARMLLVEFLGDRAGACVRGGGR